MIEPGDVVTVYFIGAVENKRRPAIVVSSEAFNTQNYDLIVALITTDLALASTPFDYRLQGWKEAGLKGPSAVRTFIGMSEVRDARKIGRLSDTDWREVQARLKLALAANVS